MCRSKLWSLNYHSNINTKSNKLCEVPCSFSPSPAILCGQRNSDDGAARLLVTESGNGCQTIHVYGEREQGLKSDPGIVRAFT